MLSKIIQILSSSLDEVFKINNTEKRKKRRRKKRKTVHLRKMETKKQILRKLV